MNLEIFHFFNNLGYNHPFVGKLAVFVATVFSVLLFVFTILYLILRRYNGYENKPLARFGLRFRELFFVLFTSGTAWFLGSALKEIFHVPRPFVSVSDFHPLWQYCMYDSFPSNHAMFFSALFVSMYFIDKRASIFYAIFAFLIGISRIIIGVHFPADIVAGWVGGALIALLISRVKQKIVYKL